MFRPLLTLFALLTACHPGPGPNASAGAEVVGEPGQTYLLDGSSSAAEGAQYTWTILDGPEDAALIDADQAVAYLIPEAEGVYTLGLEVCDTWGRCEAATTRALVGATARKSASFGGVSFGGGPGGFGRNQAPQAEASATRALSSASVIRLDGSASTDPDGDALRYRWTFSTRPTGSTLTDADIQDNTSALASFKADVSGTYGVYLVVRDGLTSDSAQLPGIVVKVVQDNDPIDDRAAPQQGALDGATARQSASFGGPGGFGKNQAPQAEASATRALSSASVIRLDGSASTDPDGDALRYRWTFTTRPAGSALTDADIQDNTSALASFKADVSGTYGVRLVVRDGLTSDSAQLSGIVVKFVEDHDPIDDRAAPQPGALVGATARSSASLGGGPGAYGRNQAPEAEASATRALSSASVIRLDGSASIDPDGDALRYRWTFSTRPTGSTLTDADIQDSTSALASFKADVSGTYGVRLVVRDGVTSDSALLPGIDVKFVQDTDPVDDRAAPQPGALEWAQ